MRKGITPIISIIVLLLITVALAGAAWTYLSGIMGIYTEKSFIIPTAGAYCSAGKIVVSLVNTGTSTITTDNWITASIDPAINCTAGDPVKPTSNIEPKGTGTFTASCATGISYTLHIGTAAGTQHPVVAC